MNPTLLRAEWRAVRRASWRLMHRSLSLVGLLSVAAIAFAFTHPEYARALGRVIVPRPVVPAPVATEVQSRDPLGAGLAQPGSDASRMLGLVESAAVDAQSDPQPVAVDRRAGSPREKHEVIGYLARKYRVNSDAVSMLVDAAYTTGRELNLDPLLLLSVIGVESGFNPFAESSAGAAGLMQLMAKVHRDKLDDFGGANIALNPVVNLRVGAVVLKDCIRRGGSLADGLRLYVGAGMGTDSGYGLRVLQEKDKLAQAARGFKPRIEPIPSTAPVQTAKVKGREPAIDHSFDTADPTDPKVDAAAGRVAAL